MEMNNNKKQSYKENPVSPNRHQRTATLTSSGLGTLSTIIVSAMIFRAVYYRVLVATALRVWWLLIKSQVVKAKTIYNNYDQGGKACCRWQHIVMRPGSICKTQWAFRSGKKRKKKKVRFQKKLTRKKINEKIKKTVAIQMGGSVR